MNPLLFLIALGSEFVLVLGQIFLKRAMVGRRGQFAARFSLAIALQTLYFFTWLALAGLLPLSQLAPFDALAPVLLVVLVHIVLCERLSPRAWVGVGLILAGVTTIAFS